MLLERRYPERWRKGSKGVQRGCTGEQSKLWLDAGTNRAEKWVTYLGQSDKINSFKNLISADLLVLMAQHQSLNLGPHARSLKLRVWRDVQPSESRGGQLS